MTFTDEKGRRNRIWLPEETSVDDEDEFMDYLVKTLVTILNSEPVDIYVNAIFLPEQMADRYDHFWTDERMDEVINGLQTNNIVMEINNRYEIPSADFIKRAKRAGGSPPLPLVKTRGLLLSFRKLAMTMSASDFLT